LWLPAERNLKTGNSIDRELGNVIQIERALEKIFLNV
jgi:hypothetical protein